MTDNDSTADDDITADDVLEAFNADDIVERPGEPPRDPADHVTDTDVEPPG